ncbi:MAG: hypothetical protein AUJ55_10185 [Proteobacteria bacterium CG1_02_64_396]|nr:MAG: hypothetical protein AUJ55_10185 [Proteobacteria bacterium CG1_02_64_396]
MPADPDDCAAQDDDDYWVPLDDRGLGCPVRLLPEWELVFHLWAWRETNPLPGGPLGQPAWQLDALHLIAAAEADLRKHEDKLHREGRPE